MKSNKLIAEFMGMTYGDPNDDSVMIQMTSQGNEVVPIESMEYHTSWDWLLPVVTKLKDIRYSGEFIDNDVSVDLSFRLNDTLLETNLDSLYRIVVEFINEYNKTI